MAQSWAAAWWILDVLENKALDVTTTANSCWAAGRRKAGSYAWFTLDAEVSRLQNPSASRSLLVHTGHGTAAQRSTGASVQQLFTPMQTSLSSALKIQGSIWNRLSGLHHQPSSLSLSTCLFVTPKTPPTPSHNKYFLNHCTWTGQVQHCFFLFFF